MGSLPEKSLAHNLSVVTSPSLWMLDNGQTPAGPLLSFRLPVIISRGTPQVAPGEVANRVKRGIDSIDIGT